MTKLALYPSCCALWIAAGREGADGSRVEQQVGYASMASLLGHTLFKPNLQT